MRLGGALLFLILASACGRTSTPAPELAQSIDPGGCVLDHVAVEAGTNHYQYDSFSSDGEFIAIAWDRGDSERGTYLLDLQTWQRTDVPALNNGATFSPDGRFLLNSVYISEQNTDIARYEIETGDISIIAPDGAWDWLPSYSPDGSKIVFNSFRTGNSDVYLYDLELERLDRMTDSAHYEAHAQMSPDGQFIIYHEQISATDFNINQLNLADGKISNLTDMSSEESYPSWSPDGEFIAFASDRDQKPGVTDLFIMTRDGDVIRKITNTPFKDAYPFWSPDGEYLYFMSYREPQGVYRTRMTDLIDCNQRS